MSSIVLPQLGKHASSQDEVDKESSSKTLVFNPDGTRHQEALGYKPRRRHIFSPLDREYADAVNKDALTVEYTEAENRKVRRKIDNVILPLLILGYCFNQFDRTNIGNAHVFKSFNEHYGITSNQKWTLALSIFYVGYCLLEMPANVLQRHIGANRYFCLIMVFWGLCSLSFVYAKGYTALLVLRVFLGIGEAGFYAGMIYYLSFWYKKSELALRISLGMSGTVPGALGGLLAFGLVRAKSETLQGWQFLFLIEAIPAICMAFVIFFLLPSFPFSASFLSPREKAIAQARVNASHKPQPHGGMTGLEGFKAVVVDLNAWLLMVIYSGVFVGVATISYFMPTLVKELGFSEINAQGMTVAPYVFGWFMVLLQSWHSDLTKDRGFHIMLSSAVSVVGYVLLATVIHKSVGAAYFALFLVIGGNYSIFPLIMSWAASTFSPTSKRGVGTAFIVSVANCISIAAPQIYFDSKNQFRKANGILAGILSLTFLAAFVLRTRLSSLNRRKVIGLQAMTRAERLALDVELYDDDPRYIFMT